MIQTKHVFGFVVDKLFEKYFVRSYCSLKHDCFFHIYALFSISFTWKLNFINCYYRSLCDNQCDSVWKLIRFKRRHHKSLNEFKKTSLLTIINHDNKRLIIWKPRSLKVSGYTVWTKNVNGPYIKRSERVLNVLCIFILLLMFILLWRFNPSIKDFFSKCDQIHSFLLIWSYLLKKFWICFAMSMNTSDFVTTDFCPNGFLTLPISSRTKREN